MAVDPKRSDLERFAREDEGGELVMLNLLRFSEEGGREGYEGYARATAPFLARVGGQLVYAGLGGRALVAEDGQAWDAVLLVRYPSRAAFLSMVSDPEYRAVTTQRTAALEEAVLQPTTAWPALR